jgi:AraC-like DNA-binding protein/mannose-6-phosphate isomerase-like protein (cupin superfamily)
MDRCSKHRAKEDGPGSIVLKTEHPFREAWAKEAAEFPYNIIINRAVRRVPSHWHDALEIVAVDKGRVTVSAAGSSRELKRGDFILLRPGTVHLFSGDGTADCLVMKFKNSSFKTFSGNEPGMRFLFPLFHDRPAEPWIAGRDQRLFVAICEMVEAFLEKPPGFELTVRGNFLRIAGRLAELGLVAPPVQLSERDRERIDQLMEKLEVSYCEQWCESRAADLVGVSYWHFNRLFKRLTGTTFLKVLTSLRVRHVQRLLLETDLAVGEIVERTGFSSHDHLLRAFRREVGMAPGRYRKEGRELEGGPYSG